jgi:phage terminase small subunit
MVLKELAKIGFTDMRNYTTWGANGVILKQSDELTPEQTAAISEVSETISKDGGSIKFKLHDKVSALEKIGRHLGMFNDKLQLDGEGLNIHVTIEKAEKE